MSAYNFSENERWAVFSTHGQKCYLCGKPVDLKSMHVDHIIPEKLDKTPIQLQQTLALYGLDPSFSLNSFENWLPACGPCNLAKKDIIFDPTPIIQRQIQNARSKAAEARAAAQEVVTDRALARALNTVMRSIAHEEFEYEVLRPLVVAFAKHNPQAAEALLRPKAPPGVVEYAVEPPKFRVTPHYTVVFESDDLKIVSTPRGTGYVTKHPNPHPSFFCGHCGSNGPWNGAICLSCGRLDDGD